MLKKDNKGKKRRKEGRQGKGEKGKPWTREKGGGTMDREGRKKKEKSEKWRKQETSCEAYLLTGQKDCWFPFFQGGISQNPVFMVEF